MSDQQRTLLTFDGDATGAKLAAQQAANAVQQQVAALQQLSAAEQAAAAAEQQRVAAVNLGATGGGGGAARHGKTRGGSTFGESVETFDASADAAKRAAAAQEEMGEITEEVSAQIRTEADILYGMGDAAEGAGKKTEQAGERGRRGMEGFANTLGMIDPRLGMVARTASRLGDVFAFIVSPAGLAMAAISAAAAGAIYLLQRAEASAERIRLKVNEMREAAEGFERDRLGKGKSAADELAAIGVGDKKTREKVAADAERLASLGLDESAARKTAAFASQAGTKLSDADLAQLALAQQQGRVKLEGRTADEARDSISRAQRAIQSLAPDQAEALRKGVQGMAGAAEDKYGAALGGNEQLIREYLTRNGYTGDALDRQIGRLVQLQTGRETKDKSGKAYVDDITTSFLGKYDTSESGKRRWAEEVAAKNEDVRLRNEMSKEWGRIGGMRYDARGTGVGIRTADPMGEMSEAELADWEKRQKVRLKKSGDEYTNAAREERGMKPLPESGDDQPRPYFASSPDHDLQNKARNITVINNNGINYMNASAPRKNRESPVLGNGF